MNFDLLTKLKIKQFTLFSIHFEFDFSIRFMRIQLATMTPPT